MQWDTLTKNPSSTMKEHPTRASLCAGGALSTTGNKEGPETQGEEADEAGGFKSEGGRTWKKREAESSKPSSNTAVDF